MTGEASEAKGAGAGEFEGASELTNLLQILKRLIFIL